MKLLTWIFRQALVILLIALGLMFLTEPGLRAIGWCDENIGGWFVPVMIAALALPIIFIPIGRGIVQGMRESGKD